MRTLKTLFLNHGPVVVGIVFSLLAYRCYPFFGWPKKVEMLLGSVLNVSAIFIGFLAAVWSILISMEKNRAMEILDSVGEANTLFERLSSAIHWFLTVCGITTVCLIFDLEPRTLLNRILFSVWVLALTVATFASWQALRLFTKVLRFKQK